MKRLHIIGRHPFMVPVVTFLVLVGITGGLLWYIQSRGASLKPSGSDIVILSYDHQTQIVPSHERTVGALVGKLHIPINQGDVVEPSLDTQINQDDFRINIYRAVPIKIVDGTNAIAAYSAATTPRSIATQAGLTIYPEDTLSSEPASNILAEGTIGKEIIINRSVPVTLNVNGFAATTRTRAKTVGAFLSEKNISLGSTGSVSPSVDTPLAANTEVKVVRDGTGIQSVTQQIAMPIQYVDDASLAYGTFAVRQAGSPGEQVLTYNVTVKGGKVVSSTLVQTVVTVQPVTQIEARGTNLSGIKGDMARAGIAPGDYQYADYIISHESGWCPTKAQGQYGGCPAYTGYVPSYGGYGLCQATPGAKMSSAGADWATNPITQLLWCSNYARTRYGGWYAAYQHWLASHNW
jgi:uncharacterized protein YabE (DUF348 family)